MQFLKLMPTILVKYMLRAVYAILCLLFRVDPYKATFASYRSDQLKDNLFYIYIKMEEKYPEIKRQLLFEQLNSSLLGKCKYTIHMIKACYHLATSRYFIIDDYYMPIYMIKLRKQVEIIQLWHSAGALKKFGRSIVDKPFGPSKNYLKHINIHGNYSKAYVSSREVIPYFAEAFGMPEHRIRPLGVPRTDFFLTANKEALQFRFRELFPEHADKKLLLYAPTFRGKSHYQGDFALPFHLPLMKERLGDKYVLLVHLHPYMQGKILLEDAMDDDFVIHIRNKFTIQELLVLTELLITDYSSVFFDFSLLNKPMVFYPYDLEEYRKDRDFYYLYEAIIPGPQVKNTNDLITLILQGEFSQEKIAYFRDRFFDYRDGKSSERIVEDIIGENSVKSTVDEMEQELNKMVNSANSGRKL